MRGCYLHVVHPASMLKICGATEMVLHKWFPHSKEKPSSERKWRQLRLLSTENDYGCTNKPIIYFLLTFRFSYLFIILNDFSQRHKDKQL